MAKLPSNLFVFVFVAILVLLSVEYSTAARRNKVTKATTTIATTTKATHTEPEIDTMIYHSSKTNDKCECGAFKSAKKRTETPLYYQTAMQNFHCDEAKCKQMCLGLPAFSENRGVEILCAHVNQAHELRPAVHFKNCNDQWLYAGITPKEPICCEGGKVIGC